MAALEASMAAVQRDVTDLKGGVAALQKDVGDLKVGLGTLTERVSHLPDKEYIGKTLRNWVTLAVAASTLITFLAKLLH